MSKASALLLTTVAIALIGCAKGGGGSVDNSPSLKMVFIPKNSGNPYFTPISQGFLAECKILGASFESVAPASGDATSQIPIIKEQIQRGVDVIAISPNSPDALDNVLDEARAKGITVITVDADITGNESHRDASIHQCDFGQIGAGQIELLGSLTGYEGPFAILSATTDAPNQNAWIAAIKESLKQPKYAKMKLVDIVYGDDQPEKSTTVCQGLLSNHPDLRGIIAPTTAGMPSAAQTIRLAGVYPGGPHAVGKGLQLTGLCNPNPLKSFVRAGIVTAFQLWDTRQMGVIAAYIGQQIHTGKLKPADGEEVNIPVLGKRKFEKLNVINASALVTFDKSNIDRYNF